MQGKGHRHANLVAAQDAMAPHVQAPAGTAAWRGNGFSLLLLSTPARLLIVAAASVLLWGAVIWALA
jgi:hypothetical protein